MSSDSLFPKGRLDWIKTVGNIIVIIMFVGGIVAWAFSQHADIREWTASQDYITKQDLKAHMKDRCVPIEKYTRAEGELKDALDEIKRLRRDSHRHARRTR